MLRTLATSSVALIVGAAPVFADLTPAQVWESLSKYYTDSGYTVTIGEEKKLDNGLELSDVALSMDIAAEGDAPSDVKVVFPKLIFTEADDAAVKSVMEGDAVVTVELPENETKTSAEEGAPAEDEAAAPKGFPFDITISAPGNETISSGTPEDIRHEYNFPTLKVTMKMDETVEDGPDVAQVKILGNATLNNMTGWTALKEGETWQMEQEIAAETASFDLDVTETPKPGAEPEKPEGEVAEDKPTTENAPKEPVRFTAQANLEALQSTAEGVVPVGQKDLATRLDKALEAGMDMSGTMVYGALDGQFNVESSGADGKPKPAKGTFSSESGELTFGMSKEGLAYSGSSKGSEFEMSVADLPFPFAYALESAAFDFAFPVTKSEEPQPFKFDYTLTGLTLADGIWNLFDPENKLPRDPANLTIALEGLGLVKQNLFDPALAQQAEEQTQKAAEDAAKGGNAPDKAEAEPTPPVPFVPQSLTINKVALDAVGAQADLTGELTFPEGTQAPVGKISGDFSGINALLDKLVEAGLVPQEQVMGARMMMTMFAKPVEGEEDQLQSEIEFKEDGSIHANGQRIK